MIGAKPIDSDLRRAADEVRALLERASELTSASVVALDEGDPEEVLRLLGEREVVIGDADRLLLGLHAARKAGSNGPETEAIERLFAELVADAIKLRPDEARLAFALQSERDRLARELKQLDGEEAVHSAYGLKGPERSNIDILR